MGGVAGARAVAARGARDRRHQPVGGDAVRGRPAALRQARPAGRRVRHARRTARRRSSRAAAPPNRIFAGENDAEGAHVRGPVSFVRHDRASPPAAPPRASSRPRARSCRTNRRSDRSSTPWLADGRLPPFARALPPPVEPRPHGVEVGARLAVPRKSTCTASYPSPKRASPSRAATSIGSARTATAGRRGCPSSATRRCATSGSTSSSRRWRRPSGASCAARSTSRRR